MGIVCIGLLPRAQALAPPPDGGYPGFNTTEGDNALRSLTTGIGNTAIGTYSLFSVTAGNFNTAVGALSLDLNIADSNTAIGAAALLFNTSGTQNTANGTAALEFNDTGSNNTANGAFALFSNTTGTDNTANGFEALAANTGGTLNTASGSQALLNNTLGIQNTATGYAALNSNTNGGSNTATGAFALQFNTEDDNTAIGFAALNFNTTGELNTAVGVLALGFNEIGSENTAIGFGALAYSTGDENVAMGSNAGVSVTTASHVICIGSFVTGEDVSDSCYIGSIFGQTSPGGTAVFINSDGKLGTLTSSRRFKEEIKPMERASEALLALKPVTFRYKKEIDPKGIGQFGLVAEEVEKVNPDLIVRDKEGKPYSVRYEAVNAMLLNEFLKEHRTVQELKSNAARQEATIARQQKQIEALTAGLQKVSAQIELSKPAQQTVVNNH
jgi:Chaperone of endosialidase